MTNLPPNARYADASLVPGSHAEAVLAYRTAHTARHIVDAYIDHHSIRVTADGNPERLRNLRTFSGSISRRPIDEKLLRDEIIELCKSLRLRFSQADINRAIRLVLADRADLRREEI